MQLQQHHFIGTTIASTSSLTSTSFTGNISETSPQQLESIQLNLSKLNPTINSLGNRTKLLVGNIQSGSFISSTTSTPHHQPTNQSAMYRLSSFIHSPTTIQKGLGKTISSTSLSQSLQRPLQSQQSEVEAIEKLVCEGGVEEEEVIDDDDDDEVVESETNLPISPTESESDNNMMKMKMMIRNNQRPSTSNDKGNILSVQHHPTVPFHQQLSTDRQMISSSPISPSSSSQSNNSDNTTNNTNVPTYETIDVQNLR